MGSSSNAIVYYEAAASIGAQTLLSDNGDHTFFKSAATLWSANGAVAPVVRPNGLMTGGIITPAASGSNDKVDVAGLTLFLNGVETTVAAATDVTITRTVANYSVHSITVNSGGSIAVVAGTGSTGHSATRDAAGGPPLISTSSVEIGQVWVTSASAGAILSSEIKQIPGTNQERFDYPTYDIVYGQSENLVQGYAGVRFASSLPLIHTGAVAKRVYAAYAEPSFAEVPKSKDFVPAGTSHSLTSTAVYNGTVGAKSASLNQGSFKCYPTDGVTDGFLSRENMNIWFKFKPDRLKTATVYTQGYLGLTKSFPADNAIEASCTITPESASFNVA